MMVGSFAWASTQPFVTARRALVTGAFSNIGSAVAGELLGRGWSVATLTNREPRGAGDDERIARHALQFTDPNALDRAFDGVDVFVNTYWVRFPYRGVTFQLAVDNSGFLIAAAKRAGARFVQVSVSNASLASPLGYYRGKAQVEQQLRESGLSRAIVRPTLVVGPNDVLTNNIAWFIRRFPLIGMPAGEGYHLQPVTLADVGRLIADAASSTDDLQIDAAGPDTFSFREYVALVAQAVGRRGRFLAVPPWVMLGALRLANPLLHDIVLTREELEGLRTDMLVSHAPPLGSQSVASWLAQHGATFGAAYTNDTRYRFRQFV